MFYPLIPAAAGFGCGILAGRLSGIPYAFFLACVPVSFGLGLAFFSRKKKEYSLCMLIICIFCLGAVRVMQAEKALLSERDAFTGIEGGSRVKIYGLVPESPSFSSFSVDARMVRRAGRWEQMRGRVRVVNHTSNTDYDFGDIVMVEGIASPVSESGPGAGMHDVLMLGVYSEGWIENLGRGNLGPARAAARRARDSVRETIALTMDEPESSFLESVFLGKRHGLPEGIRSKLTQIGAGHFLAVSGLHAGLVLFAVLTVAKTMDLTLKQGCVLGIICTLAFCFITGARVPAVRASVMAAAFLLGTVIDRHVNRWNTLALSALIILGFSPSEIFMPGFHLSFAAVAGIFYLRPLLMKLWRPSRPALAGIWSCVSVLAAVQIAVMPLLAFYYRMIPLAAPVSNLVLMPLMSLIVALGLAGGVSGIVSTGLAGIVNSANTFVIGVFMDIARLFNRVPAVELFEFPFFLLVICYSAIAAGAELLAKKTGIRGAYV